MQMRVEKRETRSKRIAREEEEEEDEEEEEERSVMYDT